MTEAFEFRCEPLEKSPRPLAALELAAEKAGSGKPLPAGSGRGIALVNNIGSFAAEVAGCFGYQLQAEGTPDGGRGELRHEVILPAWSSRFKAASCMDRVPQ